MLMMMGTLIIVYTSSFINIVRGSDIVSTTLDCFRTLPLYTQLQWTGTSMSVFHRLKYTRTVYNVIRIKWQSTYCFFLCFWGSWKSWGNTKVTVTEMLSNRIARVCVCLFGLRLDNEFKLHHTINWHCFLMEGCIIITIIFRNFRNIIQSME